MRLWDTRCLNACTHFSSFGMSKKAFPSDMTWSHNSSGISTFFRYRNPTSIKACRRSARNCGFVSGSLAKARSKIGTEVNDMVAV